MPKQGHQFDSASYPAMHHQAAVYRRLHARHPVFKVGFFTLILATVVFTIGYSAAAWVDWTGIWLDCSGRNDLNICLDTTNDGISWLNAVRAMETLALTCFALAIFVELYQDVFKSPRSPPEDNVLVEFLAFMAGIFGLVGIIVYGVQYDRDDYKIKSSDRQLHWGYGLTVAGLGLVFIAAFLIAISRAAHGRYTTMMLAGKGVVVCSKPWIKSDIALTTLDVPGLAAQTPTCYVVVHNQMVPVFNHLPVHGVHAPNNNEPPTRL